MQVPPLKTEIILSVEDGGYTVSVCLENPLDDPIQMVSSSSRLLSVTLKDRDGLLWSDNGLATQAMQSWELAGNSRYVRNINIPTEEEAAKTAIKNSPKTEQGLTEVVAGPVRELQELDYRDEIVAVGVDPSKYDQVIVSVDLPRISDHTLQISRVFEPDYIRDESPPSNTDQIYPVNNFR